MVHVSSHGLSCILPGVFTPLLIRRKLNKTNYIRIFYKSLCINIIKTWGVIDKFKFNGPKKPFKRLKKPQKFKKIPISLGYHARAQLLPRYMGSGLVAQKTPKYGLESAINF